MRRLILLVFYVGSVLITACTSIEPPVDGKFSSRDVVKVLASDEFEGRLTGTIGSEKAANYIVDRLVEIGAKPLPEWDTFRQAFQFTAGVSDGGTSLVLAGVDGNQKWAKEEVQALSFSENGTVSGQLVFAGYGLSVPESDGFSYDSFATLDVEDKIVVVLRYFPEDTEDQLRATLSRYAGLRYKAFAARERGAKGLIVVTGPRSPNAGSLVPMAFDTAISGSDIVAVSVTSEIGELLFQQAGQSIESVQESLDSGNPHVSGFEIENLEVQLSAIVNREDRTGYNVLGFLPASDQTADIEKPYVMLGAHYDHLGHGTGGNSLARNGEEQQVHNGADDNASGVAAVLLAGADLAQITRKRGVILSFWSGEELGLLGSADFVRQSPEIIDNLSAYLNFDMVGRLRDNRLSVQAVGTSSIWIEMIEELNEAFNFDIAFVADPYLPTDVISFNQVKVPSVAFFTGSHEDYHRPTDDAETVNYDGLERISQLGALTAGELAARIAPPDFIVAQPRVETSGRSPMRIFTGTIPDYSEDTQGLLLSGVVADGPAENAGLQGGDIILELAGRTIANIYDYTYALDLLEVGEPADVVFLRAGDTKETVLVPEARQ